MSVIQRLRAATAPAHDAVDAAFGAHDLADAAAYAKFLIAHARALPAVEAALAARTTLPAWRERTSLLTADLADLGVPMPPPHPFALPDRTDADWGALYVIEGSRLGGVMLARTVPPALPTRYLGAKHLPGEWRELLAAIEAHRPDEAGLLAGAEQTFALYAAAVTPGRSAP
jgi:heme oxygenase